MDMKKIKIILILCIVMLFVSSMVSVMAVSAYLYNSNEVSYNNNASGLNSTNVQGAIDELYEHATDYNSMNTRVSALEGKFVDNPNITFNGANGYNQVKIYTDTNKDGGFYVYDSSSKRRGYFYYDPSSSKTLLVSYDSSGTWGKGTLDIVGNPVKINGTSLIDLIYPVGSYIETTNSSYDPNTSLSGTWTKETIKDDFIVEQGTSGIWTYKKWNSGLAECWGNSTVNDTFVASSFGSATAYYSNNAVTFPFTIYSPIITLGAHDTGVGLGSGEIDGVTNTSATVRVIGPAWTQGKIDIIIKGLWKTYSAPTTKYSWHRTA